MSYLGNAKIIEYTVSLAKERLGRTDAGCSAEEIVSFMQIVFDKLKELDKKQDYKKQD